MSHTCVSAASRPHCDIARYIHSKFSGCIKFRRACIMSPGMIDKYPWEWPSIPHPQSLYYPTLFTPTQNPHKIITNHSLRMRGWLGLANTPGSRLYKVPCNTHPLLRTIYLRAQIVAISWASHSFWRLGLWLGSHTSRNGDCTNLTRCLFC